MVSVTSMFLCGLMMRGAMFQPQNGDLLTTLINTGGFIGDICSGILYLLSVWLGYNTPDMAGHVHEGQLPTGGERDPERHGQPRGHSF